MKVLIFIPTAGYRPYPQMEEGYTNAKNYLLSRTSEFDIREYRCKIFPIHSNRNACVGHAIEGMQGFNPDTTVWIDADTVIPSDALYKLLTPDKNVVSGMYRAKKKPYHYHVFNRWKKDIRIGKWIYRPAKVPQIGLFKADGVGMGCVRVDVEVLRTLNAPYFDYPMPSRLEYSGENEGLEFMIRHCVYTNTEEAYFFQTIIDNGFEIWVDATVRCDHMVEMPINDEFYEMWKKAGGKDREFTD